MTCPVCNCPPAQCIACTPMTRAAAMVRNDALAKAGAAFNERRHGYGPAFALACRADRG